MDTKLLDEIYNKVAQLSFGLYDIWIDNIAFTWRWWLSLTLTIIPWIIWIKIKDKNNIARLLFVGLVSAIISETLDSIGATYNIWHYDWKLLPTINLYFPWNFTLFPVSIMLMMQFKPDISKYIKTIAFSFACSFVFEPIAFWLGVYHMIHWKYWYSFIIYIPLYLFYDYIYKHKMWNYRSDS